MMTTTDATATIGGGGGGVDVENPSGTTTTSGTATDSCGSWKKKKWGLLSASLLVAVVAAISVGVTLGGGGDGKSLTPLAENSIGATGIDEANDGGTTFVATHFVDDKEEKEVEAVNKVRYLDNPGGGDKKSKVRIIDPIVTRGYDSCNELKEDLRNAANYFIESVIAQEVEQSSMYEKCDPNDPYGEWQYAFYVEDVAKRAKTTEDAGGDTMGITPRGGSSRTKKEDSYETKNQVYGVDEADVVKSDGEYVFATYGEFVYAWNAIDGANTGVSITEIPYVKVNICPSTTMEPTPFETEASSNSTTVMVEPCYYYQPKPYLVALLLHDKRLTVVVSEDTCLYSSSGEIMDTDCTSKFISNYNKLTIRIYDVSSIPSDGSPLKLLAFSEKPIKASYAAALSKENTGILAVTSSIDSYSLVNDAYRYNIQYCGLNSTEYTKLAMETVSNRTETFVEGLMDELQLHLNGKCDSIVQIAAMQSGDSTQDASNGHLLGTFVQVLSFDMASNFIDEQVIMSNIAGTLSPGWPYVYATQDFLATISGGSHYNTSTSTWDATTFIIGFDISGDTTAAPKPFCFAEIQGSTINQYAADLYDGHLRVLTAEYYWNETSSRTASIISVLKVPPPVWDAGTEMVLTGEIKVEIPSSGSVAGARFMESWGYIETSSGPSYVYDLSDPSDPKSVGGLESSEHSSYLEPIVIDGVQHMLGVGTYYNETSFESHMKITVFDISDPSNLQAKATYVDKEGTYSTSAYDAKSSRYLEKSQKLIIPKTMYSYTAAYVDTGLNFDGFVVYDVNVTDIEPIYNIRHMLSEDLYYGCNNKAYLPARSFVFESRLTTILSHTVIGTDLETGEHQWTYNLENRSNTIDCKSYEEI